MHYTPDVAIRELNDQISKLEKEFSKRDVKINLLYGLLALVVGFIVGSL